MDVSVAREKIFIDGVEENAEELAQLESRNVGKPISSARGSMKC